MVSVVSGFSELTVNKQNPKVVNIKIMCIKWTIVICCNASFAMVKYVCSILKQDSLINKAKIKPVGSPSKVVCITKLLFA